MLRVLAKAIRQLSLFDSSEPASDAVALFSASGSDVCSILVAPQSESLRIHPPDPIVSPVSASFATLCMGPYTHVTVEISKRLKDTWRVTWTRRHEGLLLRVPAVLETAPEGTKLAALRWAVLVSKRTRKLDFLLKTERRALEETLRAYLKTAVNEGPHRMRRLAANGRRLGRLNPRGRFHNLENVFATINAQYFGGALHARITWATRLGGLSTHRLAEDTEGNSYHLLTISRGYDCPEVTPEILGGIVYHECLHIAIPPRKEGGRRVIHGRDFRLRERHYQHYREWIEWHRNELSKVLRKKLREARHKDV